MPHRVHKQGDFNKEEGERIKRVQGDKTDYRFMREAILKYVGEAEREALAGRNLGDSQQRSQESPSVTDNSNPPFIRKAGTQDGSRTG